MGPPRLRSPLRAAVPFLGPGLLLALGFCVSGCAVSHEMGPISPCDPEGANPQLAWYGPIDPDDRKAGDARCGTVGPPAVGPNPSGSFGQLTSGDSLAVFSWNIDVGAGDLLTFLQQEAGLTCRGEASAANGGIQHVAVLVQEAFRRWESLPAMYDPRLAARRRVHDPHTHGDPDIVDVAASCGLALAYVPSGRNGRDAPGIEKIRIDKGNAILSTLPLSGVMAVEQPFETERKVAVAATLQTPDGGSFRLVNAHLEVAANFHRTLFTGNQTRVRQAAGLLEALDAESKSEGKAVPTLMAGDFNTWSGFESTLKMLREDFPESPSWEGHTTMGPFPPDHIFFKAGKDGGIGITPGSYRVIDDTYLSDHQALFIWVRVDGPTAPEPVAGRRR